MRKRLHMVLLLLSLWLASSCAYYQPQVAKMPLMQEKGELQVTAGMTPVLPLALGSNGFYYQLDASYAITDHWGAAFYSTNLPPHQQLMVGYYAPLTPNITTEVFGGYAVRQCDQVLGWRIYGEDYEYYRGLGHHPFVQVDIGIPAYHPSWCPRLSLMAGVGLRAGCLFSNYHAQLYDFSEEQGEWVLDKEWTASEHHWITTPMVQLGIGGKWWMLHVSGGHNFSNNNRIVEIADLMVGLTIKIPTRSKK